MTVNKEFDKNLQSIKAEYVVSFNLKDVVQKGGLERYLSKIQSENIIHPSKHLQVSLRLKGATDEDMSELIQFNDIKALNLSYLTGVTDAGVLGLASIQSLDVSWTSVSDASIAVLARYLINLQHLNLPRTRVTNASIAALVRLISLRILNLSRTGVTDAGMASLSSLTNLQILNLHATGVIKKAKAMFHTRLPNLKVLWEEWMHE